MTLRRDIWHLHHQNVGAEGPTLTLRRDKSVCTTPSPPKPRKKAYVDLTAPLQVKISIRLKMMDSKCMQLIGERESETGIGWGLTSWNIEAIL